MELSKERPDTALTRQPELSKQSKIVVLLTGMGIRRQAKLDTEDYLLFASDLEKYELADLEAAIKLIFSKPRAEGETAFPELAAIEEAIRGVIRARRPLVEHAAAQRWNEYLEAAKAEGVTEPDEETLARIAKLNQKLGMNQEFSGEVVEASHEAKL